MRDVALSPYAAGFCVVLLILHATVCWNLAVSLEASSTRIDTAAVQSNGILDDVGGGSDENGDGKPLRNWSTLIGILTAISGNVLIALALNVQRYAHVRLQKRKTWARDGAKKALTELIAPPDVGYGTVNSSSSNHNSDNSDNNLSHNTSHSHGNHNSHNLDRQSASASHESSPLSCTRRECDSGCSGDQPPSSKSMSYLRDPYWWTGQVLITVGETGNFLAYGFAPASIVSPLGVVAMVANCLVAPIIFHERFRARDAAGVVIAILGVVTVTLSAKQKETKLGPHEIWDSITTVAFEIYAALSCSLIAFLMWLSPRYGNRTILIDLGLVGLLGAYTVLSTKGVSSLLSSTFLAAFTTPITYGLLLVMIGTAVMQIRYLNKALQRFDSTQVIPIQFVLFTLNVILGSAILYRDFEKTTHEQALKFVGGCFLTFFGVFLITTDRPAQDEDHEHLSDEEGVEETLHLESHDSCDHSVQGSFRQREQSTSGSASQRSSETSSSGKRPTVSLSSMHGMHNPWADSHEGDDDEARPLISGLRSSFAASGLANLNDESAIDSRTSSFRGASMFDELGTTPTTGTAGPITSRPSPLRRGSSRSSAAHHSYHHHNHLQNEHYHHYHNDNHNTPKTVAPTNQWMVVNQFPFSPTVNAMVGGGSSAGPSSLHNSRRRRSKPSLRSSLFVPYDELFDDERAPLFDGGGISSTPSDVDSDQGPAVLGFDNNRVVPALSSSHSSRGATGSNGSECRRQRAPSILLHPPSTGGDGNRRRHSSVGQTQQAQSQTRALFRSRSTTTSKQDLLGGGQGRLRGDEGNERSKSPSPSSTAAAVAAAVVSARGVEEGTAAAAAGRL